MWVENPPSRTRRMIANTRIVSASIEELRVTANFIDDWQALERSDYLSRAAHLADHPDHAELCAVMRDPALEDSRVLLPSLPEQRRLP